MTEEACDRFARKGLAAWVAGDAPPEHEAACAACQRERAAFERLAGALRDLPALEPPRGWEARVLARVEAADAARAPSAAWRWAAPLAIAAAVAAFFLLRRPKGDEQLAVRQEVVVGETARRADTAVVGDRLRARAGGAGTHRELRVYRDEREVVARCPGDERCRDEGGETVLELDLDAPGRYRSVVLAGPRPIPSPTGSLDDDARAASEAGARVELTGRVDVE